jgi:hypothetical protein
MSGELAQESQSLLPSHSISTDLFKHENGKYSFINKPQVDDKS